MRARAVFESGIANPIVFIIACASACILVLYLRSEAEVFARLQEQTVVDAGPASSLASTVVVGAIMFALFEGSIGRGVLIDSELDALVKVLHTMGLGST